MSTWTMAWRRRDAALLVAVLVCAWSCPSLGELDGLYYACYDTSAAGCVYQGCVSFNNGSECRIAGDSASFKLTKEENDDFRLFVYGTMDCSGPGMEAGPLLTLDTCVDYAGTIVAQFFGSPGQFTLTMRNSTCIDCEAECNPTTCVTGLACKDRDGCGELNDWSACENGTAGSKFSNRKYCPLGWHMCGDGFCTADPGLCIERGGHNYSSTSCSVTAIDRVVLCDFPARSNCEFDADTTRCRTLSMPSCFNLSPYQLRIAPNVTALADVNSATEFSVGYFSAQAGCGITLYRDSDYLNLPVSEGECHQPPDIPHLDTEFTRDVAIFRTDADCVKACAEGGSKCDHSSCLDFQSDTYPVSATTDDCKDLRTQVLCDGKDGCVWIGADWLGCVDSVNAVMGLSYEVTCLFSKLDREACDIFVQCEYDEENSRCFAPNIIEDAATRTSRDVLWLQFSDETKADSAIDSFNLIDLGQDGRVVTTNRMTEYNFDSNGVVGQALGFDGWNWIDILPPLTNSTEVMPPLTNSAELFTQVQFFAKPAIEMNAPESGTTTDLANEPILLHPSQSDLQQNPEGTFVLVAVGLNGVAVYDWTPAQHTFIRILHVNTAIQGWTSITVQILRQRSGQIVVDADRNKMHRVSNLLPSRSRLFPFSHIGGSPTGLLGSYVGGLDEMIVFVLDHEATTPTLEQMFLLTQLHRNLQVDILCFLSYDAETVLRVVANTAVSLALPTMAANPDAIDVNTDQPFEYELLGGDFPTGAITLAKNDDGVSVIVANFADTGTYTFELTATGVDDSSCVASNKFSVEVLPPLAAQVTGLEVPVRATTRAYMRKTMELEVTGGTGEYSVELTEPSMDLFFEYHNGEESVLSGVPSEPAVMNLQLRVVDNGVSAEDTLEVRITIPIEIAPPLVREAKQEQITAAYDVSFPLPLVSGGVPLTGNSSLPYAILFEIDKPQTLQATINDDGKTYTVLATEGGSGSVNVVVRDVVGAEQYEQVDFDIAPPLQVVNATSDMKIIQGRVSVAIEPCGPYKVVGGRGDISFKLEPKPSGLNVTVDSPRAATVVGTPTEEISQAQTFQLIATDENDARIVVHQFQITAVPQASRSWAQRPEGIATTVIVCVCIFLLAVIFYQFRYGKTLEAHDFAPDVAKLMSDGVINAANAADIVYPKELKRDAIQRVEELGRGEFGVVEKGVFKSETVPSYPVAVKVFRSAPDRDAEAAKNALLAEALIMAQFEHENVMAIVGVVTRSEPVMVVLAYCEHGSLESFLKKRQGFDRLIMASRFHIAWEIAKGAEYLISKGFVHRDLAARNVLVSSNYTCCISDFGLARQMESARYVAKDDMKRPVRWLAPEAMAEHVYSEASDVWAFGILLYEIFTDADLPYKGMTLAEVIEYVRKGGKLARPPVLTAQRYAQLMRPCFELKPEDRPTFATLVQLLDSCRREELDFMEETLQGEDAPSSVSKLDNIHTIEARYTNNKDKYRGSTMGLTSDEAASSSPLLRKPESSASLHEYMDLAKVSEVTSASLSTKPSSLSLGRLMMAEREKRGALTSSFSGSRNSLMSNASSSIARRGLLSSALGKTASSSTIDQYMNTTGPKAPPRPSEHYLNDAHMAASVASSTRNASEYVDSLNFVEAVHHHRRQKSDEIDETLFASEYDNLGQEQPEDDDSAGAENGTDAASSASSLGGADKGQAHNVVPQPEPQQQATRPTNDQYIEL